MLLQLSPFDISECLTSNQFCTKSFDVATNDVTPTRPDSLLYSGHGPPPRICFGSIERATLLLSRLLKVLESRRVRASVTGMIAASDEMLSLSLAPARLTWMLCFARYA